MTTYIDQQRLQATTWKSLTTTLPPEARQPARYVDKTGASRGPAYDFCLPRQHAALSLLPEVRASALALFAELGIPWHTGVDGGPSNHLLSSQVECANALGQMVHDPERLQLAFADVLGTRDVLEIEPGRFLTFEYIGPTDYFNEVPTGPRIRGAHCTSVDAAFLHRTGEGLVELVLLEWKYTESYRTRPADPVKDKIRWERYGAAWSDPEGPILPTLPFEQILQEPLYQLVRQQLLAHALEQDRAHGADRVRVVHVPPQGNIAYQQSLQPAHRALGDSVSEVWSRLMRHPDRFVSLDSELFLDEDITSIEYTLRYGRPGGGPSASGPGCPGLLVPSAAEPRRVPPDDPLDRTGPPAAHLSSRTLTPRLGKTVAGTTRRAGSDDAARPHTGVASRELSAAGRPSALPGTGRSRHRWSTARHRARRPGQPGARL